MDLYKLSEDLKDSDIELRVGNVFKYGNSYGMSILAYKTARVDRSRLDEAVGSLNWKNEYFYDQKGNLCCRISIWCQDKKEWVPKEDIGTESYSEKEKGSYSDAFKRAGFKWGIGTELYNMTDIVIFNLDPKDIKTTKKKVNGYEKELYSYKKSLKKWRIKRDLSNVQIFNEFNKQVFPANKNDNNNFNTNTDISQDQCIELTDLLNESKINSNKFYKYLSSNFNHNIYKFECLFQSEYEQVKQMLCARIDSNKHGVKNDNAV